MLTKILPLPAAPHLSSLLRTQPLLHFRLSSPLILARPHELAPSCPRPRALLRRPLLRPPRSLLPQSRRLPRRFPLFHPLQDLRPSPPPRPLPPHPPRPLPT